jgi:metal-responsive CopG/Arc/MetJ family transcriptional regulator
MRVTVTFADDVAAELQRLRREHSISLSEAVNRLVRAGLARKQVMSRQADALARGRAALSEAGSFESADLIRATRDERDAEILAHTGLDPELAGLAEHAAGLSRALD